MRRVVYDYMAWSWCAVGIVWLIAALATKRTARHEAVGSRVLHIVIMAAAIVLFVSSLPFGARLPMGPLAWRFVPDSPAIAWTGLALTVAGCAFAIWARLLLGGNWSSSVTVKQDHQLIRRGPYTIVRHPIYSGFLLGMLGTALALGQWRGIAGLALAGIGWRMKSRVEEAFMVGQFGAAYIEYQRQVKALIPFVL
ncbi:MAG TPA: isoprenylcysteine carboxylmethyltransferase family protein [Bryobacteraceae bacterium]|jgi:protein-S-isoprenylcysteine O-methyltransferase Ste14|nr:isoprenylcysteine carboxylmethyltransferase family protein [Bryobacteraceae bacterium]